MRYGKTRSQPAIEEILDEPIKKSVETTTTMPTSIKQSPEATLNRPDPPSSAGAFNLPQEDGGHSPTDPLKDSTPKDKTKAPFSERLKPITMKDTPEMTTSTETMLIQEIK